MSGLSDVNQKEDLERFTLGDLRLFLKERKQHVSGSKKELVDRLWEALNSGVQPMHAQRHSPRLPSSPAESEQDERQGTAVTAEANAQAKQLQQEENKPTWWNWAVIFGVMFAWIGCILLYFTFFPGLEGGDKQQLVDSWTLLVQRNKPLTQLKTIAAVARKYTDTHYWFVVFGLAIVYLWYQTFAIFVLWMPGTASSLSILSGALLGWWPAFFLCNSLATVGPMIVYVLFGTAGRPIVMKWFGKRIREIEGLLQENRDHLFYWLFCLRVAPFFPNFMISIAAPIVKCPLLPYIAATFFGLMPNSAMFASAGNTLATADEEHMSQTVWHFLLLCVIGLLTLVPTYLSQRKKKRAEEVRGKEE
eukprot:GDKI01031108.1.p1 GENE.GDKI01031108.1~~GDKI01031108.1.p1  ORF type:complete len:362 (+),score=69.96 GDKI01031108.1:108-1193(+)